MNAADRKEFELISEKIDNLKEDIREIKNDMSMAHGKTEESLKQNKIVSSEKIHRSGEV